MNKTYKTVWSDSSGTYVAVSENTRARGKRSSSSKSLANAVVGVVAAMGLSGVAMDAYAATGIGGGTGNGTAISQCTGGSQANAGNANSIAIGCGSVSTDEASRFYNRQNPYNNDFDEATGFYAVAVGHNAKGTNGSVAVGQGAEANTEGLSVAIGPQAKAQNVAALAIGPAALATGNTALALGRQTAATADFAQAIGNVAAATGVGSLAVGHSATATGKRAIAIGAADIDNAGNTGDQQGTVYQSGEQALSTGQDSIALGAASNATANYALAVGAHSTASGLNSTAMGYYAEATGENSFASGASAKAGGTNSFALGGSSQAIEDNSIAVGVGARANFKDSVALGSFSEVLHDNSIAIGTHSKTNDYTTKEAFLYETGAAGAFATGAVSIGDGTGSATGTSAERRLQNVAAGGLDTDAVNVSQLKMHKGITDKTGDDIATHLGGGSVFNPTTGAISNPTYNIGGNEYNNVETALKATRTEVAAGDNISVVETKGTNGQTIYTVHSTTDTTNLGWNYTVNGVNETSVTLGDTLDFGNTDDNIVITKGADGLEFNLADQITIGETSPITIDGDAGTIGGLTNKTFDPDNFTTGQAATEDQLKLVSDVANTGWNVSGSGENEVNIGPDGQVNFVGDDNITVAQTGDDQAGEIEITLNKDVDLGADGSLTIGDTNITDGLVSVGGANTITIDGDVGEISGLTNVDLDGADFGTVGRAATEEQLGLVSETANKGWNYTADGADETNVAPGATVDFGNTDDNIVITKGADGLEFNLADQITIGETSPITIDGDAGTIGGLTNKTFDPDNFTTGQAATEDQLKLVSDVANTGWNVSGSGENEVNIGPDGQVNFVGDSNITVAQTGADQAGEIEITLNKDVDLGTDGSVVAGGTKISNRGLTFVDESGYPIAYTPSISQDGIDGGMKQITMIDSGLEGQDLADVTGDDIYNAVNVGDLQHAAGEISDKGLQFSANAGGRYTSKLGSIVTVAGAVENEAWSKFDDGQNIMTQIEQDVDGNSVIRVALSKDITGLDTIILGENGTPGKDGADGAPGVGIDGKDGSIGITGKDGAGADITVVHGKPGLDGNDGEDGLTKTRIVYEKSDGTTEEVATLNDGLRFVGDDGEVVERKLNETLGLVGGADVDALTENNIGVVQKDDGSLSIQLAENVDLGEEGTVTIGDTFIDNSSVSTTNLTVTGETKLGDNFYVTNEGDVHYDGDITEGTHVVNKNYVDNSITDLTDAGLVFDANVGGPLTSKLGSTVTVAGSDANTEWAAFDDGQNIMTQIEQDVDGNSVIRVALSKDITGLETIILGENGTPGKDGVDGAPGVGIDGKDGSIGITGKDGAGADITVVHGKPGLDGNDGEGGLTKTRIVYEKSDGTTEEVATLNDGLRFVGDDGEVVERKLNETLGLVGGADVDALTENNIGVVQKDDGSLSIQLAENVDLGEGGTVTIGDTFIDNSSVSTTNLTVTGETKLGDNFYVTNEGDVHYDGDITEGTHVVNKSYVDGIGGDLKDLGLNFAGNVGDPIHKNLGETLGIVGSLDAGKAASSKNIRTASNEAGELEILLAEDLVLTSLTTGETVMDNNGVRVGDNVSLTNTGLFLTGGPSISLSGIDAGGLTITNVAAGVNNTDAVNVSQLKDVQQNIDDLGDRAVKYDGETGSPKDTITLEGDKGTTITNLADGKIEAGSKDAVNGGQIHNMGESIASGMGGNSKFEDGKLITELNVAGDTYTNVNDALNGVHGDLSTKIENVENIANAGWNVTDAEGNTSNIGPNGSVAFVGDSNITVTQTGADNAGKVEISLSQDLQVNSITATTVNATAVNTDNITINNGGPIISSEGINMNDNRITNVAPGVDGTDAVNVDQLTAVNNNLQHQIDGNRHDIKRNNDRANAGIAAAMATAGLPQAYLPGKSMVAVAGGVWRGESGMAIGVSTVSENGKWVLKGSANTSGRGGAGGTIGAGYQW